MVGVYSPTIISLISIGDNQPKTCIGNLLDLYKYLFICIIKSSYKPNRASTSICFYCVVFCFWSVRQISLFLCYNSIHRESSFRFWFVVISIIQDILSFLYYLSHINCNTTYKLFYLSKLYWQKIKIMLIYQWYIPLVY